MSWSWVSTIPRPHPHVPNACTHMHACVCAHTRTHTHTHTLDSVIGSVRLDSVILWRGQRIHPDNKFPDGADAANPMSNPEVGSLPTSLPGRDFCLKVGGKLCIKVTAGPGMDREGGGDEKRQKEEKKFCHGKPGLEERPVPLFFKAFPFLGLPRQSSG